MRVTRIEIFGFKSFMERLVLPLENGITGIVGPNGCGKSNVVDALRWVLGETRATSLRGGVLEDVIFNGTEKQRPLGLAEVTITLRAQEDNFFADLVSPELEADLLASFEAAKAGNVDELNGELDGIAANDDTQLVEEGNQEDQSAPEIALSKAEEVEARASENVVEAGAIEPNSAEASPAETSPVETSPVETTVQQRAAMLTRFSWLKSVNEVQVTRRLYRSGESEYFINRVACRLKDIKDFFRAVGLGARAYTIVAQGEVTRIISAKPEDRRLILEEAAGVSGFRDKIAAAHRRLEETSVQISRLDDIAKEVQRQVNSLRVQAARARNRHALKEQIVALDRVLIADALVGYQQAAESAMKQRAAATENEAQCSNRVQAAKALEESARAGMIELDMACDDLRGKMDNIREELSRRQQQRSGFQNRLSELRAYVKARETELRRVDEGLKTLNERRTENEADLAQLTGREQELAQELTGLAVDDAAELRAVARHVDSLRGNLREQDQRMRATRDRLISAQSSMRALEEQIRAASPLNQLREFVHSEKMEQLRAMVSGTEIFAETLNVPPRYAKALQSLLAERATFIVAEDPRSVAALLTSNGKEEPTVGVFRRGGDERVVGGIGAPLPTLSSLIEVRAEGALAAQRIFDQVFVAETREGAFDFFNAALPDWVIRERAIVVTEQGELVTDHSFYTFKHEAGVIQLRKRVNELSAEAAKLAEQQQQEERVRSALQQEISEAEQRYSEMVRISQQRQAQAREISNQLGNVRGRLQGARRNTAQLDQDASRLRSQEDEARRRIAEHQADEARVTEEMRLLASEDDSAMHSALNELRAEYDQAEKRRREGRDRLAKLAAALEESRRDMDQARSALSSFELEYQRAELARASQIELARNEYGEAFVAELLQGTLEKMSDEARSEAQQNVAKLKQRLIREGDVDPTAIERFEEEQRRLEELNRQKNDLETAALTLRKTIARLTETSERRFLATFNAVRANFAKLMPKLFGGGQAQLTLLDESKPLESGVEISVRPPGKKPKSLDLLSGGEKALCATALIISMFLERPSPLCVLDEVDAPLDEANLQRFVGIIKEMSSKTQFLMITHNKASMAVADHLVGVTMREPGVSQVITVSLQEAYSQVA